MQYINFTNNCEWVLSFFPINFVASLSRLRIVFHLVGYARGNGLLYYYFGAGYICAVWNSDRYNLCASIIMSFPLRKQNGFYVYANYL